MQIKIIKIDHDTYEKRALQIAQKEINENPDIEVVYVDGLLVSDLCINECGQARKCNDYEWKRFFYTYLHNPNEICQKKK